MRRFLLLLLLLSLGFVCVELALADGPTQNEETTKSEADLVQGLCGGIMSQFNSDGMVSAKEYALEARNECVLAGKTLEELQAGQTLFDEGETARISAWQNYDLGTMIWAQATLDKSHGDDEWNAGHYATACTYYVGPTAYSTQAFSNAGGYFEPAAQKCGEAAFKYCRAAEEWIYLLCSPP